MGEDKINKPKKTEITRYSPTMDGDMDYWDMGEWVKYEDHLKVVKALKKKLKDVKKSLQSN